VAPQPKSAHGASLRFLDHTHLDTHTPSWTSLSEQSEATTYTSRNKHKRRTSMPLAGFERAISVSQTYALDQTTTGISLLHLNLCKLKMNCKQLACTCHGRCTFHIIAVTVTKLILTSITTQSIATDKILAAGRLGFRLCTIRTGRYGVIYVTCYVICHHTFSLPSQFVATTLVTDDIFSISTSRMIKSCVTGFSTHSLYYHRSYILPPLKLLLP
jgi:hypothetical protein